MEEPLRRRRLETGQGRKRNAALEFASGAARKTRVQTNNKTGLIIS